MYFVICENYSFLQPLVVITKQNLLLFGCDLETGEARSNGKW